MSRILYLLALLLTSCADDVIVDGRHYHLAPPAGFEALNAAQSCCRSFSDFQYKTLSVDHNNLAKIDGLSPAYTFNSGKSFFVAYRIPRITHPFQISIKSYYSGASFYPSALILDDKFSVIRLIANPEFSYVPSSLMVDEHIGGTIKIENSSLERYLIIYTRPEDMKLETFTEKPGYLYANSTAAGVVPSRNEARDYGPFGNLEISIISN